MHVLCKLQQVKETEQNYVNTPMQYTAILMAVKIDNFQLKLRYVLFFLL